MCLSGYENTARPRRVIASYELLRVLGIVNCAICVPFYRKLYDATRRGGGEDLLCIDVTRRYAFMTLRELNATNKEIVTLWWGRTVDADEKERERERVTCLNM